MNSNEIKGTYDEPELVKYNKKDKMYKIGKIIKKKDNKCLVKWLNYSDEFNSWVDEKDIKSI